MSVSGTRSPRTVIASRDHFSRVDTNADSINPRFLGRRVEVRITPDEVTRADPRRHSGLLDPEGLRRRKSR